MRTPSACATIDSRMRPVDEDLRRLIEHAVAAGSGMDDIESDVLDPANLPRDEHDALWLYALGRRERPAPSTIPIVAG